MHLLSSFIFAVSANIDGLIVGMSYGIKKTRITLLKSTLISLVTATGTILSILMGNQISRFLPTGFSRFIGSGMLVGLGVYYLVKAIIRYRKDIGIQPPISPTTEELSTNPTLTSNDEQDSSNIEGQGFSNAKLSLKEELFLGLTLSINNIGMGVGASISGLELLPTAIFSLLVSIVFLCVGSHIGKRHIPDLSEELSDFVCGLLLVILGIYEFFR
jgi:putative sporulation protein YtaF